MNSVSRIPKKIKYCIIGAGIHGLSTAFHLSKRLKANGESCHDKIVVLEKTGVAAGASGIACGIVRNNYYQPAMSDLMIDSIEVWEQHAEQLQYHSVGYVAVAGPKQVGDLKETAERHEAAGFPHRFVEGPEACLNFMRELYPDWKESDATAVLHESKGGFAYSFDAIVGLAQLVEEMGVPIHTNVEVQGFTVEDDETVSCVHTSQGTIETEFLIVAVGPWIQNCWRMLHLPEKIDVRDNSGTFYPNQDMWRYWKLQEGTISTRNDEFLLADGGTPPVMHVDSEQPLYDEAGQQLTEAAWGIYFKRDRGNVQGGAVPVEIGVEAEVDPYGEASPYYTVESDFVDYWTAGLASSLRRFEGCRAKYQDAPSGGIGCFSADSFPIFDFVRPNVYVIADSNHGFKMIGVGKEVASVISGEKSNILQPFRFSRFVEGELHPVSNSPFPWS